MDTDDMLGQTNFEDLIVDNKCSGFRAEFDAAYYARIKDEGRRFGYLAAASRRTSGRPIVYNNSAALTRVPNGSIGSASVPPALYQEVDAAHISKKLAFAYMTDVQRLALRSNGAHSHSATLGKNELGKLRPFGARE
jgi:hypothetical protein